MEFLQISKLVKMSIKSKSCLFKLKKIPKLIRSRLYVNQENLSPLTMHNTTQSMGQGKNFIRWVHRHLLSKNILTFRASSKNTKSLLQIQLSIELIQHQRKETGLKPSKNT